MTPYHRYLNIKKKNSNVPKIRVYCLFCNFYGLNFLAKRHYFFQFLLIESYSKTFGPTLCRKMCKGLWGIKV